MLSHGYTPNKCHAMITTRAVRGGVLRTLLSEQNLNRAELSRSKPSTNYSETCGMRALSSRWGTGPAMHRLRTVACPTGMQGHLVLTEAVDAVVEHGIVAMKPGVVNHGVVVVEIRLNSCLGG
jgi:hypothetical protein